MLVVYSFYCLAAIYSARATSLKAYQSIHNATQYCINTLVHTLRAFSNILFRHKNY